METRTRKSRSKKKRFEILKRDGFKCTYCGATANSTQLVLDHVIPFSKGGSDHKSNIKTACVDCNAGKGDVPLEVVHVSNRKIVNPCDQHLAFVGGVKHRQAEIQKTKEQMCSFIARYWGWNVGPISNFGFERISKLIDKIGIDPVMQAIDIVARDRGSSKTDFNPESADSQIKYFNKVLRKWGEIE